MIHVDTLHLQTQAKISENQLRMMMSRDRKGYNTFMTAEGQAYSTYNSQYDGLRIKHTVENQRLKLELSSCSSFFYGNSMMPLEEEQVPSLLEKLRLLLTTNLEADLLEPLESAKVTRLDIKYDFQVGNEVQHYMTALAKHTVPQHRRDILGDGQTVCFINGLRKMMFYDRHANAVARNKSREETEMSKGVIRFEVVCKSTEINRRLHRSVSVEEVLQSSVTSSLLQSYLNSTNLQGLYISTENDLLQALENKHGASKAYRALSYIKAKQSNNLHAFCHTTQHKYEKLLKEAGVVPVIGERTLPPLVAALH